MIEEGFERWPRTKNDETQRRLSHLKSNPSNRRLEEIKMATTKATKKRAIRRDWTRDEVRQLKKHSRDKTRVKAISRALKRTGLETKGLCARNLAGSPQQKDVIISAP